MKVTRERDERWTTGVTLSLGGMGLDTDTVVPFVDLLLSITRQCGVGPVLNPLGCNPLFISNKLWSGT